MTQETGALFTKPGSTILVLPMAANWMVVARRFEDALRGLGVDQVLADEELAALARRLAAETANTVYVAWLQP